MPAQTQTPLHKSRIDLPEATRSQVVAHLNRSLAATLDMMTQAKQAHWNVKGREFYALHLLFDEIATELAEFVDTIAERVTALAGEAMGTARMAAANSPLEEFPGGLRDSMDFVSALADRMAVYAALLRQGIDEADNLGDKDTADLYTEVSRAVDKRLWFLEAHLQTPAGR